MQALATEAIQGLSGSLVWLGLLHSLWLGLITSALVALVFQTRGALSHRSRYATLLVALGMVTFGPVVLTVVQYLTAGQPSEHITSYAATAALILPGDSATRPWDEPSVAVAPIAREVPGAGPLLRLLGFTIDRLVVVTRAIQPYALGAWSLVVLGLSVVLVLGVKGLNQLCRAASPAPAVVRRRAQKLGRLLRLRNVPTIRIHATLDEPCLCGLFRPVILLPERWLSVAAVDSVEAVLAHELAHARRFDHLVNLAQRIVEALLFFHPGIHWLSRSLRHERELCADALAVRLTGDPLALAKALESVARIRVSPPPSRLVGAALGGESSSLLPRIQELIGMTPNRPRAQIWPVAALPLAVAVALVAASIGFADDERSPTRPAARPSVEPTQVTRLTEDIDKAPVPAISKPESDRQISFEVRFITLEPDTWRDRLKGQAKPLKPQADMNGWIIDNPALISLLEHVRGDAKSKLVQAPKVTTFEHAPAFIVNGDLVIWPGASKSRRAAEDRVGDSGTQSGDQVNVIGSHTPDGTHIRVEVSNPAHMPGQAGSANNPEAVSSDIRPVSTEVLSKGRCDVPEGSSLVAILGTPTRGTEPRSELSERLVVITPRRVVLESEEKPRGIKPAPPIHRPRGR